MSTIADFNRIEDCDKISSECVDAYVEMYTNEEEPATLKLDTSWGNSEVDLEPAVKAGETLTRMYLSPEENPNCLVYEPERGDNNCIPGDDLSRIISMQKLKDVDQSVTPADGDIYMYDGTTSLFSPYGLKAVITQINTAITALQNRMTALEQSMASLSNRVGILESTVANHESRLQTIEALLVKPSNAPSGAKIAWGTINLYSDHNAVIDNNGNVTSLDKTHGLYTHDLSTNATEDEILG